MEVLPKAEGTVSTSIRNSLKTHTEIIDSGNVPKVPAVEEGVRQQR